MAVMGQGRAASNQQLVRDARIGALRTNWAVLLAFAVFTAGLCVAVNAAVRPVEWRGFVLGVLVTLGVVGELLAVHLASGAHARSLGAFGESATAGAACGRWHRLTGWRLIDGLYFDRHGDVDHTVIGPRGIYAIETKWTTDLWDVGEDCLVGPYAEGVLTQAKRSAERISLALNYGKERLDVKICPMVFIWGPGAPAITNGFQDVAGVRVVEGRWARLHHNRIFDGQPLSLAARRSAVRILRELERKQRNTLGIITEP